MRSFPRPGRLIHRIGNILPDASGEITVRETSTGVQRLGLQTFTVELDGTIVAVQTHRSGALEA